MAREFGLAAVCAALVCCGGASVAQDTAFPGLSNRVGPYSGLHSIADAKAAAADGFNLTVQSTYDRSVLDGMRDAGINHIDIRLWNFVYSACKEQSERAKAAGGRPRCVLSGDAQQSILTNAAQHIDEVKNDPNLAGYWILDDYPSGNISGTLVALHGLVGQANRATGASKPTICGVGGSLDHRTAADPRILPDHAYIELSLQNITPSACDVVAPYFYGAATENDPSWIDWSMGNLMPWFMQRLRAQGFSRPPLLPVSQAFYANKRGGSTYYVRPRAEDIAAQTRAYCRAGAIALLFFSWQAEEVERAYANDPELRRGVGLGTEACRAVGVDIPAAGRAAHRR